MNYEVCMLSHLNVILNIVTIRAAVVTVLELKVHVQKEISAPSHSPISVLPWATKSKFSAPGTKSSYHPKSARYSWLLIDNHRAAKFLKMVEIYPFHRTCVEKLLRLHVISSWAREWKAREIRVACATHPGHRHINKTRDINIDKLENSPIALLNGFLKILKMLFYREI